MTAVAAPEPEIEVTTYDFDEAFQQKLTALILRDADFNAKVEGLVDPSYFANQVDGIIVRLAREYFDTYRFCPSRAVLGTVIKEGVVKKLIPKDCIGDLGIRLAECYADDMSDAEFIADKVSEFARRMALEAAIYKAADLIDKGKYDSVEAAIKAALSVGLNEDTSRYDYWENNTSRAEYREEVAAGRIKPTGITTGHKRLDDLLYHKGWGRKELSCLMAPAKAGKSMALMGFALSASEAGENVLYVTLEVSAKIVADRIDANAGNTKMADLSSAIGLVRSRVDAKKAGSGVLDIYDFPTGSMSPADLRRLIAKRRSAGVKYSLIVVDYADLMRPDVVNSEGRENSRMIYIGLRGIAGEFDAAVLTATQTNREGFKATAGKMENISDDINKARTVDLLLSLNASEDEKARGESRIYFAASRNQKSDVTVLIKSEIDKARYIASITAIE